VVNDSVRSFQRGGPLRRTAAGGAGAGRQVSRGHESHFTEEAKFGELQQLISTVRSTGGGQSKTGRENEKAKCPQDLFVPIWQCSSATSFRTDLNKF